MQPDPIPLDWSRFPVPMDDGGARHLAGCHLPALSLPATDGTIVNLAALAGVTVVYAYPRTGQPGDDNPPGWDLIPGARGCTPQACAFRDHFAELKALGVRHLFGLSTQDTTSQREAAERLHLPFPLLSDAGLELSRALNLPTFENAGMRLLKRFTLILAAGSIEHVFYPVFPPDKNAEQVMAWLSGRNSPSHGL
jgi:peroxiredoxin